MNSGLRMMTWKRLTEEEKKRFEESGPLGYGMLTAYLDLFPGLNKRYV